MDMCWNRERWAVAMGERDCAAFVPVFRAAVIAVVVSSCAIMKEQTEPDTRSGATSTESAEELPAPPPKGPLTEELEKVLYTELKKFLPDQEPDVRAVAVAYIDRTAPEESQEKIVALLPSEAEGLDPAVPSSQVRVPPRPGDAPSDPEGFAEATIIYIYPGSSIRTTRCGRRSGGSRYCDFD
jgi:hypothetical protein